MSGIECSNVGVSNVDFRRCGVAIVTAMRSIMIKYRRRSTSLILLIIRPRRRLRTRPVVTPFHPFKYLPQLCLLLFGLVLHLVLHANHLINQQRKLLRLTQHPFSTGVLQGCASGIRPFRDCPFARHRAVLSAATYSLKAVADSPPKGGLCREFQCVLALYANF